MSIDTNERDRELYSFEIDWWLNCRDALCSFKSSFGGQVAVIQSGGEHASSLDESGSYEHPFQDYQVSGRNIFGEIVEGSFGRDRRYRRRWILMTEADEGNGTQHVRVLLAHYTASQVSDDGSNGFQKWPKGVESRLSQHAAVAIMLTPIEKGKRAKLYAACARGEESELKQALARADRAIRDAHRAYYDLCRIEHDAWAMGEQDRNVPNSPYIPSQMRTGT